MQRYRVLTLFALFPPIFSRSSASEWKEEGKGTAKNAKILFPLSFPRTATWLSSPLFFLIVLPQCFKTSVEKKMVVYRVISDCSCCSVFELINKLRFYTKLQLSVAETLQKPQFIFPAAQNTVVQPLSHPLLLVCKVICGGPPKSLSFLGGRSPAMPQDLKLLFYIYIFLSTK